MLLYLLEVIVIMAGGWRVRRVTAKILILVHGMRMTMRLLPLDDIAPYLQTLHSPCTHHPGDPYRQDVNTSSWDENDDETPE
jgi:hypothetical protein